MQNRREFISHFLPQSETTHIADTTNNEKIVISEIQRGKLIETPEATFKILYGFHDTLQSTEDSQNADALVLEAIPKYALRDRTDEYMKHMMNNMEEQPQYKGLIRQAKNNEIPIYIADISDADIRLILSKYLMENEPWVGAAMIAWLSYKAYKNKSIDRRTMLKFLGAGYLTTTAGEGIHEIKKLFTGSKQLDEGTSARIVQRFIINMNETIHPEINLLIITLRNLIYGKKLRYIASLEKRAEKPEIDVVLGGAHIGVEQTLVEDEAEVLEKIKSIKNIPGLGSLKDKITNITKFKYRGNEGKWEYEFHEDPELLALSITN